MSHITVVGVGRIGLPVCVRLLRAGHAVTAVDLSPERTAAAVRAGASATGGGSSPAEGEADLVLTVLPGGPELRALMLGEEDGTGGLLDTLPATTTWIDLTSAGPALAEELHAAADARGVEYLDAPIGGGVSAAVDGTLTFFVGGPEPALRRWEPVLQTLAQEDRILHMGPSGTGYLAKLLVNLLWFGQAVATGEAMLLAQAGGLDLHRFRQAVLGSAADTAFVQASLPALFDGDYLTSFGIDRVVEELESLRTAAAGHNLPFALSGLVTDIHAQALSRFGPADGELLGVAELEAQAGRKIRP